MNIRYAFDETLKLIKFFRPSFAGKLITAGIVLFGLVWGYNGNVVFEHINDINHLTVSVSASDTPELFALIATLFSFVLVGTGLSIGVIDWITTHRKNARYKNIVIELRGLDGAVNTPLKDKISNEFVGQSEEVLIDIRSHVTAETRQELERALEKVNNIRSRIETAIAGKAREDISIHVGMIAPVPFQFLFGAILDDEFNPKVWDFERFRNEWQTLDKNDPSIQISDSLDPTDLVNESELVIALSATYKISEETLIATWPNQKIIRIDVPDPTPNKIWTESDQILIVETYVEVMAKLQNYGIKKVHLALAASPSLSMRLGRHHDQRNFPEINVYQYNPKKKQYTWGINLPNDENHQSKYGKLVSL
jgi:hypothetical protein